jgi:hypothetical protein
LGAPYEPPNADPSSNSAPLTIEQTIFGLAGGTYYTFGFWVAYAPDISSVTVNTASAYPKNEFTAFVGNNTVFSLGNPNNSPTGTNASYAGWTYESFGFTTAPNQTSALIGFTAGTDGLPPNSGLQTANPFVTEVTPFWMLDGATVSAVEPGVLSLLATMLAGLGVLAFVLKKRLV